MTLEEVWRSVADYEGLYEVSNHGNVRSLARKIVNSNGAHRNIPYRMLKLVELPSGYYAVNLHRGGHRRMHRVHRLVAAAFCPNQGDGLVVCHNDGDGFNNRSDNLRWDTQAGNVRDTIQHGNHRNARKTQCINGHAFDQANTRINSQQNNRRACRKCDNDRHKAKRSSTKKFKLEEVKG